MGKIYENVCSTTTHIYDELFSWGLKNSLCGNFTPVSNQSVFFVISKSLKKDRVPSYT